MHKRQSLTIGYLADAIGASLIGDPTLQVHGVATLEQARPGALSFLSHKKYRRYLTNTQATAVVLAAADAPACPTAALVHADPYLAYARAMRILYPSDKGQAGVHPSAVVDPSAQIHSTAWIGPLTVIEAHVRIDAGVVIGPACVVETDCQIGTDSRLVANVTLCRDTQIGCRVLIQPGAVIGSDGFGFARDNERWLRIPQIGRVCIGNDVEIGANTTIDRGSLGHTLIADGVILDNLIQIGHNVQVGEYTAVVACTGISGSTKIGKNCLIGGDVGIAGHLEIGDGVYLAAGSKVTRNLRGPGYYGGVLPVDPEPLWRRNIARLRHLDELARRVRQLEQQVKNATWNGRSVEMHDPALANATPDI
jgi:UDP-3-O-[3-hydroxymyristoyl] glucosamine N-acyltransferase